MGMEKHLPKLDALVSPVRLPSREYMPQQTRAPRSKLASAQCLAGVTDAELLEAGIAAKGHRRQLLRLLPLQSRARAGLVVRRNANLREPRTCMVPRKVDLCEGRNAIGSRLVTLNQSIISIGDYHPTCAPSMPRWVLGAYLGIVNLG